MLLLVMTNVIAARVDERIRHELEKESEKMNISINALTSSILKKYVEWDRFVHKDGFISMPKESFDKMLSSLTTKDILELAEITSSEFKKLAIFSYGEPTIDNLWNILQYWLESSNIQTRYIGKKLLIKHQYKTKGTLYLKSLITALVGEYNDIKIIEGETLI